MGGFFQGEIEEVEARYRYVAPYYRKQYQDHTYWPMKSFTSIVTIAIFIISLAPLLFELPFIFSDPEGADMWLILFVVLWWVWIIAAVIALAMTFVAPRKLRPLAIATLVLNAIALGSGAWVSMSERAIFR